MRAFLVVVMWTSIAHAQPGMVEPQPPPVQKKVSTAMWLALGTTVAGAGLFALGEQLYQQPGCYNSCDPQQGLAVIGGVAMAVGPSLGHAYAGHTWNAGLGLRLGGAAAFGLGWLAMVPCFVHPATATVGHPVGGDSSSSSGCALGAIGVTLGAVGVLAGTVTEIATTPGAVADYNRAHAWSGTFALAPVRTRDGIAPGVAYAASF